MTARFASILRRPLALGLLFWPLFALGPGCRRAAHSDLGEAKKVTVHNGAVVLPEQAPQRKFLKIETVGELPSSEVVSATGKVSFDEDRTSRVSSPVSGRVTQLLVKPGDEVKTGQGLLVVASPEIQSAQSDLVKALSDRDLAERNHERVQRLAEERAASQKDLTQAQQDLIKARAEVERARSRLRVLGVGQKSSSSFTLRAPIDGTVTDRTVLVGTEVRADQATPLLTISNLNRVWVLADIYEQDLSLVQKGAKVSVKVPAYPGESFEGEVAHVGNVVDATSRTVKLRCVLENPDGKLKPEMFATINIRDTGNRKLLAVPQSAVISGAVDEVIVAEAGGRFRARRVTLGPEVVRPDGRWVRIVAGLNGGEKVVTRGSLLLKHELDGNPGT